MATKIDFVKNVSLKELKSVDDLDKIFINDNGTYISLSDAFKNHLLKMYVKKKADGIYTNADLKDLTEPRDIIKNKAKLLYFKSSDSYFIPKLFKKTVEVKDEYVSTSMDKFGATEDEKVPFGLNRTLKVQRQDPSEDENAYLYVQINGKWEFVPKNDIVWFDETTKTYQKAIDEGKDLSSIIFSRNSDGASIEALYPEYEYIFPELIKKEVVDFDRNIKKVVTASSGEVESITKLNGSIADQHFERVSVQDPNKPGAIKNISQIRTKNYIATNPSGTDADNNLFVSLTFKNMSGNVTKMIDVSKLVDDDGNVITDLNKFIGKSVNVNEGDTIAKSEPITYEQANLRYTTLKSFQQVNGAPTNNSCLRLKNGSYVKEMETVGPISYQTLSDDAREFDKYLVKVKNKPDFVVVDRDYYVAHHTSFDSTVAPKKLARCSMTDPNCAVIQTSSKKAKLESCKIVSKKLKSDLSVSEDVNKLDLYNSFKTDYINGEYEINDVVVDGSVEEIESNNRYEYTDEIITTDHAENLKEYQNLNTQKMSIKNGKLVGGSTFNVAKANMSDYNKLLTFATKGFGIVAAAGILVPVVGSVAVVAYTLGTVGAIPLIPISNAVKGILSKKDLADKIEYNRKEELFVIKEDIKELTKNQAMLSEIQFNDVYARLMSRINTLSQTTDTCELQVVNGEAKVNENNINLAHQYCKDYKKIEDELAPYKKKYDKLKKAGKAIPADLQANYDRLTKQLDDMRNATYTNSKTDDPALNKYQNLAYQLKFYYNLTHSTNVTDFLNTMFSSVSVDSGKFAYDDEKGLIYEGLSLNASEYEIATHFSDEVIRNQWEQLRDEFIENVYKMNEFKVEEPKTENIEDIANKRNEAEIVREEISKFLADFEIEYEGDLADYKIFRVLSNNKDNILTDIDMLLENIENSTDLSKINENLEKLKNKKLEAEQIKANNLSAKENLTTFNTTEEQIEQFSNEIEKLIKIIPKKKRESLQDQYKILVDKKPTLVNSFKNATTIEDMKTSLDSLYEFKDGLETLKTDINNAAITAERQKAIDKLTRDKSNIAIEIGNLISITGLSDYKEQITDISRFNDIIDKQIDAIQTSNDINEINEISIKSDYLKLIALTTRDMLTTYNNGKAKLNNFTKTDCNNRILQVFETMYSINEKTQLESLTQLLKVGKLHLLAIKVECGQNVKAVKAELDRYLTDSFKEEDAYEVPLLEEEILEDIKEDGKSSKETTKKKIDNNKTETKNKKKPKQKDNSAQINSEKLLLDCLNLDKNQQDRIVLIEYIKAETGIKVTEKNIQKVKNLITEKHGEGEVATNVRSKSLNNKINVILVYGQKFLTIKEEWLNRKDNENSVNSVDDGKEFLAQKNLDSSKPSLNNLQLAYDVVNRIVELEKQLKSTALNDELREDLNQRIEELKNSNGFKYFKEIRDNLGFDTRETVEYISRLIKQIKKWGKNIPSNYIDEFKSIVADMKNSYSEY